MWRKHLKNVGSPQKQMANDDAVFNSMQVAFLHLAVMRLSSTSDKGR